MIKRLLLIAITAVVCIVGYLAATGTDRFTQGLGSFFSVRVLDVSGIATIEELALKEITTPTAIPGYAKIYPKADNVLYFQDGAGSENLLHGDAFSDLWYHGPDTSVTIAAVNTMTLVNIMENVRGEDDLGNAVGSPANNNIVIGASGGGIYNVSHHASITVAGGAKKEMLITADVKFATPPDITNVTDDTVSPIVVTIGAGHNIKNGDMIEIVDVLVNTAANGSFMASAVDATTITLIDLDGGATTGNGDYDEGTPTGNITHCYPGDLVAHRVVSQTDIGSVSATGSIPMVAGDEIAVYVANVDDGNNLSVVAVSLDIERIGD